MKLILKIFDYISSHSRTMWISLTSFVVLFILLILNVKYSEDISDFLPLGTSEQEALSIYQNISGANRIYILFNNPDDADYTVEAIESFMDAVHEMDTLNWCSDLTAQFDISQVQEVTQFVYENIPYFLTPADYARMDSLLALPGYISSLLKKDKEMLMFPTSGVMISNIMHDPLSLFSPVLGALQSSNPQVNFEMYDGYIFTPDMSRAIAMMSSPFGNSETEYNTRMVKLLHSAIEKMSSQYEEVTATIVGGPEIAVGNSSRIKKDSIIAISLSVILIVLFVIYSIGSFRNVLLIFLSIGWGWLFAMGGMSLFSGNVSIIVIGISSVILGIAVNYPLHLIVHMRHVSSIREAMKEILVPLVIGNITTVSAFLTLIPLQSAALRDLGIFASLLLVGTILFVLIYMPHFIKGEGAKVKGDPIVIKKIANFSPEKSKIAVAVTIAVTLILSFFSTRTEFDSNMANINYMTREQRDNMQYFQSLVSGKGSSDSTMLLYVYSSGDEYDDALEKNSGVEVIADSLLKAGKIQSYKGVSQFLVSEQGQQERLGMWRDFVGRHHDALIDEFSREAYNSGFSKSAFSKYLNLIDSSDTLSPRKIGYFSPLTTSILSQNVTHIKENNKSYIVNALNIHPDNLDEIKGHFPSCFDVAGMNSAMTKSLSDNFNYIGWCCSLIVFIFLWFSFGRLETAIIAFIPMAVSWIWILGIMALLGIKFNIVNIILATFIFGQGDDYTIFMTEGCQHEYKYRRPILASYKSSIFQSALIMFIGIGTLIVSKHPAMKSLAEVTIIGMLSVVLMSYMIPPLLFRWVTAKNGVTRRYPLTLRSLFFGEPKDPISQIKGRYIYKGYQITSSVRSTLRENGEKIVKQEIKGVESYTIVDNGYGESALLLALTHPDIKIIVKMEDDDKRRIAEVSAMDFIENIEFIK